MELKVWVEGIQRIVCGVTEATTCQVRRRSGSDGLLSATNKSITIRYFRVRSRDE